MLTDVPVVVVLDAEVAENLEQIGKIQQGKVDAVFRTNLVLHRKVDPENKKRLYQQVDKEQEKDVDDKFAVHGAKVRLQRGFLLPQ